MGLIASLDVVAYKTLPLQGMSPQSPSLYQSCCCVMFQISFTVDTETLHCLNQFTSLGWYWNWYWILEMNSSKSPISFRLKFKLICYMVTYKSLLWAYVYTCFRTTNTYSHTLKKQPGSDKKRKSGIRYIEEVVTERWEKDRNKWIY